MEKLTIDQVELEAAKEILRAHNLIHNTNIRWEALPKNAQYDLEFKARAVMEWIGKNAHRIHTYEEWPH